MPVVRPFESGLVSVVLCTYNRPDMLRDALHSVAHQRATDGYRYEVVVIYGGETEETVRVIEEITSSAPIPIRSFHETGEGQVAARNRALVEARGEWLAHFDDDQIADEGWLAGLLKTAQEKQARVLGGVMRLKLAEGHERPLSWNCRRMLGEGVNWDEVRPYTRKEGPGTGNLMVHRTVFDELGEFDPKFKLRGYDTDFYRRVREADITAWYTPEAIAYHVTPAERLTDEYFHMTSLHTGWSFARRDLLEYGSVRTLGLLAARAGQVGLMHIPRWMLARVSGKSDKLLHSRCRLWLNEGYARSVLYKVAPQLFRQKSFFSRYDFRS